MKIGILQINICKDINENIIKISKIIWLCHNKWLIFDEK